LPWLTSGCDVPRPETANSTHPPTTKAKHEPAKPATSGADDARQQKIHLSALADRPRASKVGEKGGLGVTGTIVNMLRLLDGGGILPFDRRREFLT